jgi:hypothetical protein
MICITSETTLDTAGEVRQILFAVRVVQRHHRHYVLDRPQVGTRSRPALRGDAASRAQVLCFELAGS